MAKATEMAKYAEECYQNKDGYIWGTAHEKWTAVKQQEMNKTTDENHKMARAYGAKWIGSYVEDCSGLIKYSAAKAGLKGVYHGCTSIWNKQLKQKGLISKKLKLPVGALVFTGDDKTKEHVGILVTETCVCEAKGTQQGVVHTPLSNKKWKYWGLLKGMEYEAADIPDSKPEKTTGKKETVKKEPTLRRGDKGEDVKRMQQLLSNAGSGLVVDGIFGLGTLSAVRAFQKANGLVIDGIVGPKTWAELNKYAK